MCDTNKQIRTEIVLVLVLYFEYARHFLWFHEIYCKKRHVEFWLIYRRGGKMEFDIFVFENLIQLSRIVLGHWKLLWKFEISYLTANVLCKYNLIDLHESWFSNIQGMYLTSEKFLELAADFWFYFRGQKSYIQLAEKKLVILLKEIIRLCNSF